MSVFSDIISNSIGGILKEGRKIIDEFVTTDEEKAEAKHRFERMVKQFSQQQAAQITKRHKQDMNSDSWLSKNVRPLMLIYALTAVTVFALLDGTIGGVSIPGGYIDLLGNALIAMIGFYFGSRGVEKWKSFQVTREVENRRNRESIQRVTELPRVTLNNDDDKK